MEYINNKSIITIRHDQVRLLGRVRRKKRGKKQRDGNVKKGKNKNKEEKDKKDGVKGLVENIR